MPQFEVCGFQQSYVVAMAVVASIWTFACQTGESNQESQDQLSTPSPTVTPQLVAEQYLATAGPRLGLPRPQDFQTGAVNRGRRRNHVRMRQLHRGVPVFGAETIVHVDGVSNQVAAFSDSALR